MQLLGTSGFSEAFKPCRLALAQACAHQNTSHMLQQGSEHIRVLACGKFQTLLGEFIPCAIPIHRHQQTPEQGNLIWLYEVISVIFR